MVLDMTQDEISLEDLTVGDPSDPATPLVNKISANLERNSTNLWESSFRIDCKSHCPYRVHAADPIKAWIQTFRSVFKRRAAPSNAAKTTHEQTTPLIWEDLEDASHGPTIDDGPRFASVEYLGPWFPEANPAHPKAQTLRVWRSKRQTALSAFSIVAAVVLLINIATTVYFKTRWKTIGGLGTIYQGNCSQSHRINSRLHIVINVLSTALLSASNFCMQLLAAPTRQEIDKAHKTKKWLDIGVPSVRNLKYISKRRGIAIFLLATSSIPLHFL